MAEDRPDGPLAANVHIMQWTLFEQASVGRIRILQSVFVENYFLNRSNYLHNRSLRVRSESLTQPTIASEK